MAEYERELAVAEGAARLAAAAILRHYVRTEVSFASKDDGSPVSEADLEANRLIAAELSAAFPDDALLTEESPDDGRRLQTTRVWIVDPLDGTRGFLARTDDFCVHVALAVGGIPMVAVVLHPVSGTLCRARLGAGAFRVQGDRETRLQVSSEDDLSLFRLGVSRHNARPSLLRWLDQQGFAARVQRTGASLKYLALAAGEIDGVVTSTGGEKEWDTCAPELIVREAGGTVTDGDGRPLRYNQPDIGRPRGIVASNGRRHADLLALVPAIGSET